MDTNGLSVGNFVEIYPKGESSLNEDHIGIIFDFENRGIDGVSARVFWLTGCNYTVHWNVYCLRKTNCPKVIEWESLINRLSRWFGVYNG